jgi:TolB-like protein
VQGSRGLGAGISRASWQAIVEEVIAALSRFRYLSVIVGKSSFAYKVKNTDVKRVGRE